MTSSHEEKTPRDSTAPELTCLLERKQRVLLSGENRPLRVVLDPEQVTPCGEYIRLGQFFSDEVDGYYPLQEVLDRKLTVLKEF